MTCTCNDTNETLSTKIAQIIDQEKIRIRERGPGDSVINRFQTIFFTQAMS